ncbi:MAG: HPP family protein [Sulfurovum sp.]
MSKLWSRFSSKRRPDKYSVPQAELSQPRNLIGGHILSAVIGMIRLHLLGHRNDRISR